MRQYLEILKLALFFKHHCIADLPLSLPETVTKFWL